jgi:hypothetical protein
VPLRRADRPVRPEIVAARPEAGEHAESVARGDDVVEGQRGVAWLGMRVTRCRGNRRRQNRQAMAGELACLPIGGSPRRVSRCAELDGIVGCGFQMVERPAGAFQQPITKEQVLAVCGRAFGDQAQPVSVA